MSYRISLLPSDFTYGAFLDYSVRGTSRASVMSRSIMLRLKQDGVIGKVRAATWVAEEIETRLGEDHALRSLLDPAATLVPMPRSTPIQDGWLWPAQVISDALVERSLGAQVVPLLARTTPVARSATAAPANRPKARDHFDSFSVDKSLISEDFERLLVVDDVVTRGATIVGACQRLASAFPDARIEGFAVFGALHGADLEEVEDMFAPKVDVIRLYASGKTFRYPKQKDFGT